MRVGSLFAGIGGFDLAAERAAMTLAWQSENDPHASRVIAHRFDAPNLGDIHGIESPPTVDVLTGGFPCQDYSVAGNRGGLAGDRGALWWEYHRLIVGLRPTWVVAENVPGLLSSRDGQDFETIIGSLTELGYGVAWAVLDAQYFGVAQRRRRVFIVGHSGGVPRPEVLALSEGLYGHPAPSRGTGKRVAALTANGLGGGGPDDNLAQAGHGFKHNAGAKAGTVGASESLSPSLQAEQTVAVAFAQNQRDEVRDLEDKAGALAAQPGMKQQTYIAIQGSGSSQGSEKGWKDDGTQFTLNISERHGISDGASVRRLTPLEYERLQGFPDHWTNIPNNSDNQRYRQLGNAVAVPVVEWIMRNIANAD